MPTAAFDFDGTLILENNVPNLYLIDKMRHLKYQGWNILILTSRNPEHEEPKWIKENEPNRIRVLEFVQDYALPVSRIIYRNHQPKAPVLKWLNVDLFYDDEMHEGIPDKCMWVNTSINLPHMSVICPGGTNHEEFLDTKSKLDMLTWLVASKNYHPYLVAAAMVSHGFRIFMDIIDDHPNTLLRTELKCQAQEVIFNVYRLLKKAKTEVPDES